MRFLRRRSEFVVLAIVALAAQILLSLGHYHAGHAADRTAAQQCRTFLPPSADQPCKPHHHDDKDCAICWTIGLAGTGVLSAPPALAVPTLQDGTPPLRPTVSGLARISTAAFQARAPPVSPLT
jgi:hypothetical protein